MDVDGGKIPEDRFFEVENADFREYRDKFKRGGDFVIFSDVKWYSVTHSWDV